MSKDVNVKIIQGFEIKPNTKYVLVLPQYMASDVAVGKALTELFQRADSQFVGLIVQKPDDVKILEVPQKKE